MVAGGPGTGVILEDGGLTGAAPPPSLERVVTLDRPTSVRWMDVADLPAAAALQQTVLPGSFFVRLGRRYLQAYLETFVSGPHGVALVAVVDEEVVGMLVGTTANQSHYAEVSHDRGRALLLAGLSGMVTHPTAAVLFLRTRFARYLRGLLRLRGRRFGAQRAGAGSGPNVAVLTHVAVDAAAQGRGLGCRARGRVRALGASGRRAAGRAGHGLSGDHRCGAVLRAARMGAPGGARDPRRGIRAALRARPIKGRT